MDDLTQIISFKEKMTHICGMAVICHIFSKISCKRHDKSIFINLQCDNSTDHQWQLENKIEL